mgnify:CR=1 FL=1
MAKGEGRGHRTAARRRARRSPHSLAEAEAALDVGPGGARTQLAARPAEPAARLACRTARDETANVEVRRWGEPRSSDFTPRDHVELGERLRGLDFEAGGAHRRLALRRDARPSLARLHRALAQFMLDLHTREHGLHRSLRAVPRLAASGADAAPASCPSSSRTCSAVRGEQGYYLIPTAEVPVTNLVRDADRRRPSRCR